MVLEILNTILLSVLPISELRGAIPYGIISGLNTAFVFMIAVVANILIIPVIFFFLDYIHRYLMYFGIYSKLFGKFIDRTKHRAHGHISKYGYFGLTLLVAIPLPLTGAYTGTLAAWLFGMERKKAILALSLGVVIAGVIVTAVVLTGVGISIFVNARLTN